MKTTILRKCKHCGLEAHTEDDLDLFKKERTCKYGRVNVCKKCARATSSKWRGNNKQQVAVYNKQWAEDNKEYKAELGKQWRKKYPHKKNALTAKRRAAKLQATPLWFEQEKKRVEILYATAQLTDMHVDHIVPLQNKKVCGLHCLHNLQLLTPTENISKGNRYDQEGDSDPNPTDGSV